MMRDDLFVIDAVVQRLVFRIDQHVARADPASQQQRRRADGERDRPPIPASTRAAAGEAGEAMSGRSSALPRAGLPGWAIGVGALVAGVLLFTVLDARRRAASTRRAGQEPRRRPGALPAPPPPLYVPPGPAAAAPIVEAPPAPPPPAAAAAAADRLRAAARAGADAGRRCRAPPPPPRVANEPGAGRSTAAARRRPRRGRRRGRRGGRRRGGRRRRRSPRSAAAPAPACSPTARPPCAQGTLIPAVLETALDSTRPGFARAIVSRDVRGFDGTQVLIPRGSRLIGEYRSEVAPGQHRALVIWTRLIRPDGVTIAIGSPAGDPLGRGGIRANVNSHFFERFAGAILQSGLDIGVNLASPRRRRRHRDRPAGPARRAASARSSSRQQITPTLTVRQGTSISIFVARDLDFTGRREPAMSLAAVDAARARRLSARLSRAADRHAGAARRHRHLRQPARRALGRDDRRRDRAARRAGARRGHLARLARQIAALSHQGISREHPLLSATLPDGARVQVVAPPATRGPLALADPQACLARSGARRLCRRRRLRRDAARREAARRPRSTGRWRRSSMPATLPACSPWRCKARKNILVSGGTSTGKTTFLNALIREIPAEERLILIEDTPELVVQQDNVVGLLAARSALGEAQVSANDLLAASLRMRPGPDHPRRAARRGGLRLPARDQHRPSRLDDHGPCRQRRAGDRADRAARAAGRHPARAATISAIISRARSTSSSSSTRTGGRRSVAEVVFRAGGAVESAQ